MKILYNIFFLLIFLIHSCFAFPENNITTLEEAIKSNDSSVYDAWSLTFRKALKHVKPAEVGPLQEKAVREMYSLSLEHDNAYTLKILLRSQSFSSKKYQEMISYAVVKKRYKVLECLLTQNISPNFTMVNALTPLQYAIIMRNETLVTLLLNAGANPYVFDPCGFSTLHLALLIPFYPADAFHFSSGRCYKYPFTPPTFSQVSIVNSLIQKTLLLSLQGLKAYSPLVNMRSSNKKSQLPLELLDDQLKQFNDAENDYVLFKNDFDAIYVVYKELRNALINARGPF